MSRAGGRAGRREVPHGEKRGCMYAHFRELTGLGWAARSPMRYVKGPRARGAAELESGRELDRLRAKRDRAVD